MSLVSITGSAPPEERLQRRSPMVPEDFGFLLSQWYYGFLTWFVVAASKVYSDLHEDLPSLSEPRLAFQYSDRTFGSAPTEPVEEN